MKLDSEIVPAAQLAVAGVANDPQHMGVADLLGENAQQVLVHIVHQVLEQIARRREAPSPADMQAHAPSSGATPTERRMQLGALTPREREVLELVARGASNKQIARQLDLSLHTVKRHVANILTKLNATSRIQAGAWVHAH